LRPGYAADNAKVGKAMNVFLQTDINLMAIILLGLTCLGARKRLDRQDELNRHYLAVSWVIILGLLLETATCYFDRLPSWRTLLLILYTALFAMAPILAYLWFQLVRYWVLPKSRLTIRLRMLTLAPAICGVVLALLSPLYGFVFSIDAASVYQRGPLFPLQVATVYLYFCHGLAQMIRHRQSTVREDVLPLFVLGSFSLLGGLGQSLFYGSQLMWSSAGFSLVIVYSFLQQRMVHLDQMTGTWTRASGEHYLNERIGRQGDERFGVILFDMDELKQINDRFGHLEGDRALRQAVKLIRTVVRKSDVVARYGGDEFLIVTDCNGHAELDALVNSIRASFQQYGRQVDLPYRLDCSFGAALYDAGYTSMEQFLNHVDNLMYEQKRRKKSLQANAAAAAVL